MKVQDVERALHRTIIERQRLEELEKAYRMVLDLMAEVGKPIVNTLSDAEIIREAVDRMEGPFKAHDVYIDIKRGYRGEISKPHVSAAISEMAKDRYIRIISRGAGRRGSVYERV